LTTNKSRDRLSGLYKTVKDILHILGWILGAVGAFKIAEFACWLMSQRSTMFNIGGLLTLTLLLISIAYILINKTKEK
jgi:hypothetical protein